MYMLMWCLFVFAMPAWLFSEKAAPQQASVIHEAFVSPSYGNPIYRAISSAPPSPRKETIPEQNEMQAEWIPGYWSWNSEGNAFVWVSGVWRRPPPGYQWISGFWKADNHGWIWFPGFWSPVAQESIVFVNFAPPEEREENISPAPSQNYFWVPGYWRYSWEELSYVWVRGRWELFDPQWTLVPAVYVWRPEGYAFISAHWDWPIENRGTAYSSASEKMTADSVVRALFPRYPDYLSFFEHHWHFHQDLWREWNLAPLWWKWNGWWAFSWQSQWALWWWYTHPGYPQPDWMTQELTHLLPPALHQQIAAVAALTPPPVVTAKGIISSEQLLHAIKKMRGNMEPIFPGQSLVANRVVKMATDNLPDKSAALRPLGQWLPLHPDSAAPLVHKPVIKNEEEASPERISLPYKPKIPHYSRSPVWEAEDEQALTHKKHWDPHRHISDQKPEAPPAISDEHWRKMQSYQDVHLSRPPLPVAGG